MSDISTLSNGKQNANGGNDVSDCFATEKHHERTNNRDGRTRDSFHRFVNKGPVCFFRLEK